MLVLSLLQAKLLYTTIIIFSDYLFLMIPFLLHHQVESGEKHDVIGNINSVLGGALLSLAFTNLMADANTTMQSVMPDFPLSYVFTVAGVLCSCFIPRLFRKRTVDTPVTTDQGSPSLPIALEDDNDIDDNFQLIESPNDNAMPPTPNLLLFVAMSFFETFAGNIVIGMQNETAHLLMLTFLIVIGDAIQMIAIGLAMYKNLHRVHQWSSSPRIFLPLVLLFAMVLVTNMGGTLFGMFFVFVFDSTRNKQWMLVASECMLALNAGIFLKISLLDMIQVELSKHADGSWKTLIKILFTTLGSLLGVLLTTLIKNIS